VILLLLGTAVAAPTPDTLAVAYHGDFLTHPGAAGRAAWRLSNAVALEAELGGWWHPANMVTAYVRTGPAVRLTGPRGGTWGAFAHGGVQHGIWATPTYRVDDEGLHRAPLAGDTWWHLAAGLELGHTVSTPAVDAWFLRPQVGLRVPTFHGAGIDLALEAGVRFGGGR
jgi:hypothetical protein